MAICGTSRSHDEAALEFADCYHKESMVLGLGSFSVVKIFTEKSSGNECAVKIVKKAYLKPDEIRLLEQESNILSKLKHRNVVKFKDSFSNPQFYYLVMELLTGGGLYQYVTTKKRTSHCEENVVWYMRDILNGLHYCHGMNIIHRDLKPMNLCVAFDLGREVVKLIDFGVAVDTKGRSRYRHGIVGTLGYRAPEMINDEKYGTAVDLYGCGCVLYNLLIGCHPGSGEISLPSPHRGLISNPAVDLLAKLLNPYQDKRITAAQALNHSFCSLRERGALNKHLDIAVERLTEFTQKKMWKTAAAVGVITSVAMAPIVGAAMGTSLRLEPLSSSKKTVTFSNPTTRKSSDVRSRY